jgi:excisionase family DNA binding protein
VLLTVEEAALALGLGRSYTYTLVRREHILSVKVGRKRRIPVFALEEFVARQIAMQKGA